MAPPEMSFSSRLRKNLFGSPLDCLLTIICLVLLGLIVASLVDWAFLSSVWQAEQEPLCRESSGACWSVIDARHRIILFGLFPYEEHWRSTLACIVMIVTIVASCVPWFWQAWKLSALWITGFGIFYVKACRIYTRERQHITIGGNTYLC